MNIVIVTAHANRHVPVDLYNHSFGSFAGHLQMGGRGAEVEPTVLIHRRYLNHHHIYLGISAAIIAGQLRITDRHIVGKALADQFALDTTHVRGVPAKMLRSVRNISNGRAVQQDAAANFHVRQLLTSSGKRLI